MDVIEPLDLPKYDREQPIPKQVNPKSLMRVFVLLFGIISLFSIVTLYSDYLWFNSVNYQSVFLKILISQILLFIFFAVFAFIVIYINIRVATKDKKSKLSFTPIIAAISLFVGLWYRQSYMVILAYLNRTPFNITDPIFSKDLSFYLFTLPFLSLVLKFLILVSIITFIFTLIYYLLFENAKVKKRKVEIKIGGSMKNIGLKFSPKAKYHLSGIGALFFLFIAINYYLSRFSILYSVRGVVKGAGFTDVFISLPAFQVLIFFSVIMAVILFIWPSHFKKKGFIGSVIIAFFAIIVIGQIIAPGLVQSLYVLPNELEREKPYIEHNIEFTRKAYGLDKIDEQIYDVTASFTAADIPANKETLDNIRLWDSRPLEQTYKQIQEIRSYYEFTDVDIDRYTINGTYTQIMLSARELDQTQLAGAARTWVNEHLVYTHGYGATASPVNKFTEEGLPRLLVKDIPPGSEHKELQIDQPRIYYGEIDNDFIIVKARSREFDYPSGDQNVYTNYEGTGGVPIDSLFNKLIMSIRFKDIKLLLTSQITKASRIMFNRNIRSRLLTIAPFILYDKDPYLVIANNRLQWIIDGYTITDKYPYSERYEGINYIRNSVKVVVDAYNGDVTYYVIENEPIISTYSKIFPDLFKPFSSMDPELQKHIRYPEAIFRVQSQVYRDYHMRDPLVFYNKEDKWDLPNEIYGEGQQIEMEPYYIIMKLPGEDKAEFIIMTPFTPHNKNNMIGWLAGRSDDEYGKLVAYKFSKEKLIFGPMQVEARIDQDSEISKQLTLWDQRGSNVIRGNLLIIPIEHSLLYIEPLYLLAERTQLPELKRVIIYYDDKIVMEKRLDLALEAIFGLVPQVKGTEEEPLLNQAIRYYDQVQDSMKLGDWTKIGQSMANLQRVLENLKGKEIS